MARLLFTLLLIGAFWSNSETLIVVVKNVQVGKGNIVVGVFDSREKFFKRPVASATVKANSQSLEFSFLLPPGEYAVAVYQDKNENQQLDKGWFSIPKEPYGLSNNYRPTISAPTFEDCKFYLAKQATITITLK